MSSSLRPLAGRALLGTVGLAVTARRDHRRVSATGRGQIRAAVVSVALPALALAAASNGKVGELRLTRRSPMGHGFVLLHAASVSVLEELVYRLPVVLAPAGRRLALAGLFTAAFGLVHLPRGGRRGARVALLLGGGWTQAATSSRSVFWPIVGHACYDFAVLSLHTSAGAAADRALR